MAHCNSGRPQGAAHSRQRDRGQAEIDAQHMRLHVVQAEKPFDAGARRKRVREHGKVAALMPYCLDAVHADARHMLSPARGGNRHSARRRKRVVTDEPKRRDVQRCHGRAGVDGQTNHHASRWTKQLRLDDNEPPAWIERIRHKMTAASSGIRPVYMRADRDGRREGGSASATRYTSSRSLLWQSTLPLRTLSAESVSGSPMRIHSEWNLDFISDNVISFSSDNRRLSRSLIDCSELVTMPGISSVFGCHLRANSLSRPSIAGVGSTTKKVRLLLASLPCHHNASVSEPSCSIQRSISTRLPPLQRVLW